MKTIPIFIGLLLMAAIKIHATPISASADTYVEYRNPDTVYGALPYVAVANDGGSFNIPKLDDQWAILRFDLSSVSGSLSSATLNLQQISNFAAYEVYSVADGGADENFNEGTYTFNTSAYATTTSGGGQDGALNKNHSDLTLLGAFSTSGAPEAVSFSSANLLNFLNADANNIATLILYQTTQDKNDRQFASREAVSGQPYLDVVAIPEPLTLPMAALGALALGRVLTRYR